MGVRHPALLTPENVEIVCERYETARVEDVFGYDPAWRAIVARAPRGDRGAARPAERRAARRPGPRAGRSPATRPGPRSPATASSPRRAPAAAWRRPATRRFRTRFRLKNRLLPADYRGRNNRRSEKGGPICESSVRSACGSGPRTASRIELAARTAAATSATKTHTPLMAKALRPGGPSVVLAEFRRHVRARRAHGQRPRRLASGSTRPCSARSAATTGASSRSRRATRSRATCTSGSRRARARTSTRSGGPGVDAGYRVRRRAGGAPAVHRGLLRRVPPRPRRQQRRGGPPPRRPDRRRDRPPVDPRRRPRRRGRALPRARWRRAGQRGAGRALHVRAGRRATAARSASSPTAVRSPRTSLWRCAARSGVRRPGARERLAGVAVGEDLGVEARRPAGTRARRRSGAGAGGGPPRCAGSRRRRGRGRRRCAARARRRARPRRP